MEEIKVGEYVRTKNQGIKRIDTIFENKTVNKYGYEIGSEWDGKLYSTIKTKDIFKHSKNIIDLIEVGDYVNGKRVMYVDTIEDGDGNERLCVFVEETQDCIEARDIKSIVTKEVFRNAEYRVETN